MSLVVMGRLVCANRRRSFDGTPDGPDVCRSTFEQRYQGLNGIRDAAIAKGWRCLPVRVAGDHCYIDLCPTCVETLEAKTRKYGVAWRQGEMLRLERLTRYEE